MIASQPSRPNSSPRPERVLVHPLWLGALALLVLNDHLFKGSGLLPGGLTGKLSDVAGLVMAPALLATLLRAGSRRALLGVHLAIGAVFAAIKLSPAVASGFEALMALGPLPWYITVDPSDLLALPALLLSWRLCNHAMSRPVEVARPLARLATGAGLLASMATSPPPPPGGMFPSINADLVIGAATDDTLILRIRPLRDTVHLDCAAAMRSPTTALSRALFAPAVAWQVEAGRVVQVQGDGVSAPSGECFAALIDGTLHRASASASDGGEPIPLALLFWTSRDFPPELITSTTADAPADRLVRVGLVGRRAAWLPHAALFPPPPEAEERPIPGCEPAPEGGVVDWQTPVPVGARTIEAIESAPDGCHRITMTAGSWYVCTGTPTLPFAAGDEVHLSLVTVGQAFRAVEGVRLLGDGDAAGKRLVAARGADLATFGAGEWSARDLPECDGSHGPCGNLVIPQELTITGGAGTDGAIPVMAGDAVTLGGTLFLHRAERVPIGDAACLPDAATRDGLVLESVYVEPRIEE